MSRPWSQDEVEQRLVEAHERLEEHVLAMPELADEAADAKVDFEVAFAKALLAARHDEFGKAEGDRKALATVAAEKELRRKVKSETTYDTHKRVIGVLGTQADILRTMAASRRQAP